MFYKICLGYLPILIACIVALDTLQHICCLYYYFAPNFRKLRGTILLSQLFCAIWLIVIFETNVVVCSDQDKPEPPPEGRLPDATKGQYSKLVSRILWLVGIALLRVCSWLLQVLTIWEMCLAKLWGLVTEISLLCLGVTLLYVMILNLFVLATLSNYTAIILEKM